MTLSCKIDKPSFDVVRVRAEFPALNGVTFLDSAASAQKPLCVIKAMDDVLQGHYANVHRGVYKYSQKTTELFEAARTKIAHFIGALTSREIIFTRNATEAINLVAFSWGRATLKQGDEIILSAMEHHANIVPWYLVARETGAVIKVIPISDDGALDMAAFKNMLSPRVKMVAVTHVSNVLGTVNDVHEITRLAKSVGAKVLIDGAQGVVHCAVDVTSIGCDFYAFTGHKLYGPTGIGVLYGRGTVLQAMPPYQGGGEMIELVDFDHITFKDPPYRFEAGTPAFVEAIGLGVAIDWISGFDRHAVDAHEKSLLDKATKGLMDIKGVRIFGTTPNKAGIISFAIDGVHPHDAGTIFDQMNVAVRAGHHCAQPLMKRLGVSSTLRASFCIYNTMDDVMRLIEAVIKTKSVMGAR